ncbi:hypothetical protein TWF730_011236 [Orbilia blumenaviensis]|uniref:Uncharacterized protein n=1 Tax=Orbilia blumenaviensis TaxID=1796055 RepID=A0AAV9UN88_9PEZI
MVVPIYMGVPLALILLASEASAYTLSFFGDAACSGVSTWQHSTTNDSTYMTPCEQIPASTGNVIKSAAIVGDATDNHWAYTAQLFSDPACNSEVTTISSKEECQATGSVRSFVVVGTESDFQMPSGGWNPVLSTSETVESQVIGGDAVYNETQTQYYETDNLGNQLGSSSSSISYDNSEIPVPVIYPMDDASLEYATTNNDEAAVPGGVDEAILDADCGDTVVKEAYATDANWNGLADGKILEETTLNAEGNVVKHETEEYDYPQDIAGAYMIGDVVSDNTAGNNLRDPDPVLDVGSSGTSTSTGWPAAVLSRE